MLATIIPDLPWTFVGGKGGVGKTTVATALAIARADAGLRTLVVSFDPAHSLGDALGVPLSAEPQAVPRVPGLLAMELDAERERKAWLARWHDPLSQLLEGGTMLSSSDIDELLALSLPGSDELAALLQLSELRRREDIDRLVIDTAPTGHALRLIESPSLTTEWIHALEQLDQHRRTVAETLTRRAVAGSDAVRAFLDELTADIKGLAEHMRDPSRTTFVLVTTAEPVVLAETARYRQSLDRAGLPVGALVVNRVREDAQLARDVSAGELPVAFVPRLESDPHGVDALRAFSRVAAGARSPHPHAPGSTSLTPATVLVGGPWLPPTDRALYIVAGKGGVGKTTCASAIAAHLAASGTLRQLGEDDDRPLATGHPPPSTFRSPPRTLLLSVDPAGSLGDVWATQVGHHAVPAPGCDNLFLRQLDAHSAWQETAESGAGEIVNVLEQVVGGGADELSARIRDLSPPGVDELVALAELVRQLEEPTFDAVVLDTAPTGHFLRLLDTPALALDWAHAILRLMLRYREIRHLDDSAEQVLRFAQAVKRLAATLRDRSRTFVMVVALPEALSVPETERLLERLAVAGVPAGALVINRLLEDGEIPGDARRGWARSLLTLRHRPLAVGAPALSTGPTGFEELSALSRCWRRIELPVAEVSAA